MADITSIEQYKAEKLSRAEKEFAECMIRAEQLHAAGKHAFAKVLVDKAKVIRITIDRLRYSMKHPSPIPQYPEQCTPESTPLPVH